MDPLPAFPFLRRRDAALARLESASLLLPAAPVRTKNADSEYRYRPDSDFFYLTGWEEAGGAALLRGFADERRFLLFVPETSPEQEMWTGKRRDAQDVQAACGADAVLPIDRFSEEAPALLAGGDRIHYRLGASSLCDSAVKEALRRGRGLRARAGKGAHAVIDPGVVLDALRMRKDPAEIARLREAARITVRAFEEALAAARPGVGEWEVEAALEGGFRRRGARGPAYASIVAAGRNACTLHYGANASVIGPEDLVLVDGGAEVDFYAADVTRTVIASERAGEGAMDVHAVVRDAHAQAIAACRPGAAATAVHAAAVRAIADGLRGLGALVGTAAEIVESKSYRPYFPHQTTHWIGLDVHDCGPYRRDGRSVVLEPGMAFTVEPGLYFPEGSCPAVPALEGVGVRIEDDVLMTENGPEVLTSALSTGPGDFLGRRLATRSAAAPGLDDCPPTGKSST